MEKLLEKIHQANQSMRNKYGTLDAGIEQIIQSTQEILNEIQSIDVSENTPATINAIRQKLQRIQEATRSKVTRDRTQRINGLFDQLYNALSPNRPAPNRLTAAISRLASAATRAQATRTRAPQYQYNRWVYDPAVNGGANLRGRDPTLYTGGRRTRRRSKLYL